MPVADAPWGIAPVDTDTDIAMEAVPRRGAVENHSESARETVDIEAHFDSWLDDSRAGCSGSDRMRRSAGAAAAAHSSRMGKWQDADLADLAGSQTAYHEEVQVVGDGSTTWCERVDAVLYVSCSSGHNAEHPLHETEGNGEIA